MSEAIFLVVVVVSISFGVYSCENSDWRQAQKLREAAQVKRDATPHLYRDSPDGCKVYRFKVHDQWQFYTRCPGAEKVSTQTNWKECHMQGKQNVCKTKSNNIETTTP